MNEAEEQTFQAAITTMGLDQREEYMEITTSWERKGAQKAAQQTAEQIAVNSLREGLSIEMVVKITGLSVERVQQLQAQLQAEN